MNLSKTVLPALVLPLAAGFLASSRSADAAGVMVGNSSLIGDLDYSDTFTGTDAGGAADRPYIPAIQPAGAYIVENTYGNPAASFNAAFSIAADSTGTPGFVSGANPYPLGLAPNASGAGSNTGFTQTGGGGVDFGIPYGLRTEYIVQTDAVQVPDRIDISSGAGVGIFAPNSLSVFFRGDGSGNASLFNGTTDTPIQAAFPGFNTGITGFGDWHNYAARFDIPGQEIELFVDEVSLITIDLTTFAGGIYGGWDNSVVGVGAGVGGGGNRTWTDNFQVGGVPEPSSMMLLASGLAGVLLFRRRK
jgi:hypothetical protein